MSSITACKGLLLGYDDEERPLVTEFWRESDFIGFSVPGTDWSVIHDVGKGCIRFQKTFFVQPCLKENAGEVCFPANCSYLGK